MMSLASYEHEHLRLERKKIDLKNIKFMINLICYHHMRNNMIETV